MYGGVHPHIHYVGSIIQDKKVVPHWKEILIILSSVLCSDGFFYWRIFNKMLEDVTFSLNVVISLKQWLLVVLGAVHWAVQSCSTIESYRCSAGAVQVLCRYQRTHSGLFGVCVIKVLKTPIPRTQYQANSHNQLMLCSRCTCQNLFLKFY